VQISSVHFGERNTTMRFLLRALLSAFMLLPVMAAGAQAQSNLELEVRGDVNLPTGDFSEPTGLDADAKLGLGAVLFLPVHSRISLYGGGGQEYFDCEDCPGDDDEVITSGFEAGVKIPLPAEDTPLHPWVRAGLVYYTVDVTRGGLEAESDWNLVFPSCRASGTRPSRRSWTTPASTSPAWKAM
jgi:hypothetical protein